MTWKDARKKQPMDGFKVLAVGSGGGYYLAWFEEIAGHWVTWDGHYKRINVAYWQHLPALPKEIQQHGEAK